MAGEAATSSAQGRRQTWHGHRRCPTSRTTVALTFLLVLQLSSTVKAARDKLKELDPSTLAPAKAAWINDYFFTWGEEVVWDDGTAVIGIKDPHHKGGGWSSRQPWIHGVFSAMIKVPSGPSCGVVSAFYLTSEWNMSWTGDFHDEIDFEILGDDNTGEILLQTNYFVGGVGKHEERLKLWFDPTLDFHEYKIQVNKEAVRWYVDGILVREITEASHGGLPKTSQFLVASIWDGSFWVPCSQDKKERTLDFSKAPYMLYFKNVTMISCYWRQQASRERPECADPKNIYFWDEKPRAKDRNILKYVQDHFMVYSWETWNTTGSPMKIVAPEERTSKELFDLSMDGHLIRGQVKQSTSALQDSTD